jgi:hypothetical protein
LIHFGLDFVPAGAIVQSATLGVEQHSPGSGEIVHVYRITQSWSESDPPSWNSFASNYDDSVVWGSFASTGGWVTASVTELVSAWVSGSHSNYGMMLINGQAMDDYLSSDYSRVDRRPWLEVCYVVP